MKIYNAKGERLPTPRDLAELWHRLPPPGNINQHGGTFHLAWNSPAPTLFPDDDPCGPDPKTVGMTNLRFQAVETSGGWAWTFLGVIHMESKGCKSDEAVRADRLAQILTVIDGAHTTRDEGLFQSAIKQARELSLEWLMELRKESME